MNKNKKIVFVFVLVAVAVFAFFKYAPKYFFDTEQEISVLSVHHIDSVGFSTDITKKADCEYLENTLHLLKTYRGKQIISSHKLDEDAYSIYLAYNDNYYFLHLYDSGYYHIYDAFE
ncbi:MAG: hypothetical protein IKU47_09285, partial [Oscillospiraceae bacterium]|nr:hypothetical protein [Oscillospiraceae bacterium]